MDEGRNSEVTTEQFVSNLASETVTEGAAVASSSHASVASQENLHLSAAAQDNDIIQESDEAEEQTPLAKNRAAPSSTKSASSAPKPILSQVGTIDQVISKKLPKITEKVAQDYQKSLLVEEFNRSTLGQMLKALDENQNVFVKAFITVKKQHSNSAADGQTDEGDRIDIVQVNQFDKIIEYLSGELTLDLSAFRDFFKTNYS